MVGMENPADPVWPPFPSFAGRLSARRGTGAEPRTVSGGAALSAAKQGEDVQVTLYVVKQE